MRILDFRSDTVTKPSPEMRAAMASADVGDDILDRDPTMDRLERRVAEMLGHEAGLWTPSGCMANAIALMAHLQRGDRFLAPALAHVMGQELGTPAWLAGGLPEVLPWEGGPGKLTPHQVARNAANSGAYYALRTTLLCLENTHNFAGGTFYSALEHRALVEAARNHGLKVHLDGARLWNASAASGAALQDLAWGVDSVSVCLSKGLGAPMGSVLCGSRGLIEQTRRLRKMLGGAVRQGGVVAAAGLAALDHLPRLAEDHAMARRLAEGLRALGFNVADPPTNILMVPVLDIPLALRVLEDAGIRALPVGSALRFLTHRDLTPADVEDALLRMKPLVEPLLTTWEGPRPMV